jgi:hypothetical protein
VRYLSFVSWAGESFGNSAARAGPAVSKDHHEVRRTGVYLCIPDMNHEQTASKLRASLYVARWPQAAGFVRGNHASGGRHASWMLGVSKSSENTNTPGAEMASCTSFAAAAPLADFAINRKGSSLVRVAPELR